jgi:predicted TIM-barrel fold metal-dependent hydrolase
VDDIGVAATAFPDLTFEVVHSGWAFLEDCALQMVTHPNIYANLECVANFLVRRPTRFAHVLGTLRHYAGDDRLLFGTGATACHPAPVLAALAAFEMPQELVDGEGYRPVDDDVKAKILGGNYLRLHGLDPAVFAERLEADPVVRRDLDGDGLPRTPWRLHRERSAVLAA